MRKFQGLAVVEAWTFVDSMASSLYLVQPDTDNCTVAWRRFFLGMAAIVGEPESKQDAGQLNATIVQTVGNAAIRAGQQPKLTELPMTLQEWQEYLEFARSSIRIPDTVNADDPLAVIVGLYDGTIEYFDDPPQQENVASTSPVA